MSKTIEVVLASSFSVGALRRTIIYINMIYDYLFFLGIKHSSNMMIHKFSHSAIFSFFPRELINYFIAILMYPSIP